MVNIFKNKVAWLVLAFVMGIIAMFAQEANADTSVYVAPETQFIAGDKVDGTMFSMVESFGDNKYEIGIHLNMHTGAEDNNAAVTLERVVRWKKFGMSLGVAAWKHETPAWNSTTTFSLGLRWEFDENWSVKWAHFSTGGSSSNNGGLDMIMGGYSF